MRRYVRLGLLVAPALAILAVPVVSAACGDATSGNPSAASPDTAEASPSAGAAEAPSVVPAASPATLTSLLNLTFELTGGFQGLARRLTISGAGQATFEDYRTQRRAEQSLSPQDMAELEALLESSAFISQDESQSRPCADCFSYRITVEWQDRSHSVEANDLGVDPRLAGLVEWLTGFLERGLDQ